MPLLQLILTLAVTFIFCFVCLVLAWYIALPLLFVGILLWVGRELYQKWIKWHNPINTNGCFLRRTTTVRAEQPMRTSTVIDVDNTEIH